MGVKISCSTETYTKWVNFTLGAQFAQKLNVMDVLSLITLACPRVA